MDLRVLRSRWWKPWRSTSDKMIRKQFFWRSWWWWWRRRRSWPLVLPWTATNWNISERTTLCPIPSTSFAEVSRLWETVVVIVTELCIGWIAPWAVQSLILLWPCPPLSHRPWAFHGFNHSNPLKIQTRKKRPWGINSSSENHSVCLSRKKNGAKVMGNKQDKENEVAS